MIDTYFFDSESIGFYSPTVMIQYAIGMTGEIVIHNLWEKPVGESLNLIEKMCQSNVIGFNLSHDWFHISRTYGVLSLLPKNHPPSIMDYLDVEDEPEAHDKYCLKPKGALDLMLYGRAHEFQATMKQKDIIIRRVPINLAKILIKELEHKVSIPKIYFAKRDGGSLWKIKELHLGTVQEVTPEELSNLEKYEVKIDPDFVNLRLSFHPSTSLKAITKFMLNKDVDLIENMLQFKHPKEHSWYPSSGDWLDVAQEHIMGWSIDKRRLQYAKDDVVYTRDLFKYFNSPWDSIGEYNSMLACMVGSLHWKGFEVDLPKIEKLKIEQELLVAKYKKEIEFDSPKKVVAYLHEVCNPIEKTLVTNSAKETLNICKDSESLPLAERATKVLAGREARMVYNLLNKLSIAKRMYVTFKVIGTKSNRMSGGSMTGGRGGSINPQGIKKGGYVRELFTLAPKGMVLDGGDFDGFEVSIFEAVSGDPLLREDLLSGKSIHALWGSSIYGKDYDVIKGSSGIPEGDPEGYYSRSKKSFFAKLYDAQVLKLSQILLLSEEETYEGIKKFETRYKSVAEMRERVYSQFSAMSQPDGIGTAIKWKTPKQYVESFLGFKRYFTLEFSVVETLFKLAQEPTEAMKSMGHFTKVKRRDRLQTAGGALQSALYAGAFSIQSSIIRAAMNHEIQSPGGEITKRLEAELWGLQPKGINDWVIMPFNVHDEIEVPVLQELQPKVKAIVEDFIERYKEYVPLLSMTWKQSLNNWGEI